MVNFLQHWSVSSSGKGARAEPGAAAILPKGGYEWIHMNAHDPATRQWLVDDPDIDILATDTLMSGDSRPRTMPHAECLLINLRGVNLNEGSDVTDMVGIRFIVTSTRIVSVERRPLKAVSDLAEQLASRKVPSTTAGFMAWFSLILADRMAPTLNGLSENIDDLEEKGDADIASIDRSHLASLRRDIIALRRFLSPQRDALNSLAFQNLKWISERDRLHIRNAADQTTRIAEELDALRERCTVIRDHLTDHRAETMNRNMMVLSVVAAIFLPLGLISGMMGINVGGMPWTNNPMGFWYVTGIVAAIGLCQLLFFRFLKWI